MRFAEVSRILQASGKKAPWVRDALGIDDNLGIFDDLPETDAPRAVRRSEADAERLADTSARRSTRRRVIVGAGKAVTVAMAASAVARLAVADRATTNPAPPTPPNRQDGRSSGLPGPLASAHAAVRAAQVELLRLRDADAPEFQLTTILDREITGLERLVATIAHAAGRWLGPLSAAERADSTAPLAVAREGDSVYLVVMAEPGDPGGVYVAGMTLVKPVVVPVGP